MFCILLAMSRVRSAVEPPAPQVMSQKEGLWATMRSMRSKRFSTPSSVFGGKNSKENTVRPSTSAAARILSTTFIVAPPPLSSPDLVAAWPRHRLPPLFYTRTNRNFRFGSQSLTNPKPTTDVYFAGWIRFNPPTPVEMLLLQTTPPPNQCQLPSIQHIIKMLFYN